MKKSLRMLAAFAACGGLAHGTVFIETGFEGSSSLPAGWTQSTVSGSATWNIQQGGGAGGTNPTTARSGTNNATLYVGNTGENKTRLTSPVFDTVGYTNLSLTFWHTQALWSPDQDQLKVFFSSDGGTNWTELAYYTTSVPAWTQRTLVIPSASANSRIAFEGNAKYGYGVCLDDIQVTGIPGSISEMSVSASDASASEVGPDPGTWTITRIGNTTGAVSVNFTLSGNATINSDYTAAPSSPINFAAGETSKVVTLTPIDDAVGAEGNELATLTLTTGTGYAIGTASASISIYDDEGYDLNILVIGSTHSFSEGGEHDVVHEKPFNPSTIATHLHQIIDQDPAISGSVNVQFEDIYKTKALSLVHSGSAFSDYTSHCYSLIQHLMWPDGKANRLANLRGQAGTQWDYIIITHDPYIMANFPGMVAEGVKRVKDEVAQSTNPAQVVLLAQWPDSTSTFTADEFNKIAFRVGNSAGLTVVPAGKVWDSYSSKDTSSNHPTPRGEYLAAASIYSKIYNRSAKTSVYDFPTVGDAIADHALSVVQANNGVAQYSGTYTSFNPFQMKYLTKRVVNYRETGTSTEDRLSQALQRLDDVHRITFGTAGYAGVPGTRWDFNYGRGGDLWEDDKDYEVNPDIHDWVYGFPMHHNNTTAAPNTMPYGIDKHYSNGTSYEDGTDLGTAYNMIRPNTREPDLPESVRSIPIRLMWLKMAEISPGFNPLGDSTHMSPYLNDASAAFMYTLLSGRCPIVAEPTPQNSSNAAWMQWLGHKIGYETAWQMSHLTTRAPGFQVLPSATAATTVSPTTTETMSVQFAYPPQANVTVTVSSSSPSAAIVSPTTLVFTPSNYNTPQQVKVAGIPGTTASPTFNVNFTTSSTDEIYNGLGDSWAYTNNRTATSGLTQVDNGTSQVTVDQYATKAINLGVAAANAGNTIFAGPHNGSITWQGNGVILYTPTGNYLGTDQIVFAVTNGTTQTIGSVNITVVIPEGQVNVSATDAAASETLPNPGTFVITRAGSTASPINVIFSLGGTATLTSDYTLSHTSPVTIPAGQSSVTITLTPVDDSTFGEGNETAILTISADPAYSIGLAAAAITIEDNDNNAPVVNAGADQTITLGASVPWSPSVLAPQLWLDGSTATENAGTVSIANAGSGGGTVSGPAALAAGGIGTLQAVQFNGSGKYLTGDYTNTGSALSAFFVGKSLNTTQTAYAGMMSVRDNAQASDWNNVGSSVLFNQNNTTANSVQTYRNAALSSTTGTLTAGFVAGTVFDGATNTAYLNGTVASSPASSGAFNAGKVVLGARWESSAFTKTWNGNFGEAIICNANLSTTDRQNVEGYLAHKWGLAGSLAVGHPHKDMPPGGSGAIATLDASVTDADGQTPTTLWTKVSGPGTVTFANASAIDTTATFAVAGVYTLRLTANDGFGAVSDDIVITVSSGNAVTYNGNGGTGSVPVDASSPYTSGSTVTVLGNTGTLVRTGHTFNGWNTQADGLGTSYAPGATFTINSTTTLYAKWTINSYTITFDSAGGSAVTAITQNYGTTVTAPADPTRNGYTFAGWSPSLPATMPANSQTVTALWTTSNYAVTYNGNGSTGGAVPIDVIGPYTNGSTVTVLGNTGTLVRTGHTFNGWNTQADGLGTSYAPTATFTISSTTTLYAKWTINSYTITFDSAGGSAVTAITQNYGTTVNAPTDPTRSGYTFTGWSPSLPVTMPANNLAVTAQWTINTYAVTYDGNGNTGGAVSNQTKTYAVNLTLSGVGTLVKTGYVFTGWNTAADGNGIDYAANAIYSTNAPLALFAKWDRIPTVAALNPTNGATGASPTGNLTITFSENIAFGTGAITLRRSDGTLIESYNVASPPASLSLSGATVTLNPTSDLAVGITYYVEIDATAIDDLAGNSFAGFSGSGTWSFSILPQILADSYLTGLDVAAPVPLYSSLNFPSILDGPLTGSATLTHAGLFGSQLSLVHNGSNNTFNGNIIVDSGTLRVAGSPFVTGTPAQGFTAPGMTSSDTITINRAGILTMDDNAFTGGYIANRFGSVGQHPALTLAGGRINLTGLNNASSSVQSLGALTSSSGYSIINVTRSNGNPTLSFDSLAINSGSVLNFYSTTLGTGSADARITFTSAPTLTNGIIVGAKVWNPATAGVGDFATYGANGVAVFTAYDVVSSDINTGSSAQNFQMTEATTPAVLTADRVVNSLNYKANGGTWSLGGFKLTLTSGMLLRNGTNSAITIDTGTLTAGNGTDDIDLHIFTAQQNMTINAVIADNAASAVTLVKSHGNQLSISGGAHNTYTGGTYVVDGTLATGNVAGRNYLGSGKVTVNAATLTLGSYGATSNSTGDDFTVINGGQINLANVNHGGNGDSFHVGANGIISASSSASSGLASLTRGTNITLAADSIINHQSVLSAPLSLTTGTIQNLGTNADLYYGVSTFNQDNAAGAISIGNGTAFKGIAAINNIFWDKGTINVTNGTTDVYIKTNSSPSAAPFNFTLGSGNAGGPVISLADAGTLDINILGNLIVNDAVATYGDTGASKNVRFVAAAGSTLQFRAATTGMGSGSGIASALIENGGLITASTNADALNGAVTVAAGGRFDAALAGGLTGTGQLTFNEGSILNITNATGFSGTQATNASVAAGTIVRVGVNAGTASETLDSFLGSKSPIYQLTADVDVPEPTSLTTTLTLNKNASGVGGIVTNGLASAFFRNNVNGQVSIGANGGVMAATTNTELQVQENIVGTGVTLTIGTTAIIDGAPKLGSVALGSAAGSNTYTGETIINAGTLRQGYANVLGALTNTLTVNGGTLNMNGQALTVGNLTGTGGIINGGGTLTIGQGDNGGGNYQGSIQANTALTKTGTGAITLSGTNTYTGATAINAGKLFINGNQTSSTGNVTVAANATLGGTGTLGGNAIIAAAGKLEFDISTASGSHNPLDFVSGKGLTFSGTSELTITSSGGASPGTYTLITGGNNIGGSAPATLNLPIGWAATVSISGNNLQLNVTSTGGPGPVTNFQITGIPSQTLVGTTITGITLTARDAANATATSFTGSVTLGGTSGITGTSANFVAGILTGVSITPAVVGSNLTLTVDDGAGHTGSVSFNVQSLFEEWASSNSLTGGNATSGANPDGDNLTNLQEFAFGMNPNSPSLAPLSYVANGTTVGGTPILEKPGATYRAVFARRKDHVAAGLTYTVSFSADLASWTASATSPTRLSGDNADTMEAVSIDFPATVPLQAGGSAAPRFFRVAVTGN